MSNNEGSLVGDLVKMIPGYGAYVDQESRREDDRKTREFLVGRLGDCKATLAKIGRAAVERADLETPARVERIREGVDRAAQRLSAAVEGYAGWFSERKVDADLLGKVAELDANLVSLVDQMDADAKVQLGAEKPDFETLGEATERLHQRIDRRSELLKNGS
ncbi:MAG: hypothetical protein AAGG44_09290 [Planctomycetota bacterium]